MNLWDEISIMGGMDLSEAAASLRVLQALPISDPMFEYIADDHSADELAKAVEDSQLLVSVLDIEPREALRITRTRNDASAQAQEQLRKKVARIVRKSPEWQEQCSARVNQLRWDLNKLGYSTVKSELWDRVINSMVKFVAVEVGAAT